MSPTPPEAWLRGPIAGYAPQLMPAVHALLQAREDIERVAGNVTVEELWQRPGGAAAAGFHLQHVAGSLSRLFTYARGESLTASQLDAMRQEGAPGANAAELVAMACDAIDRALDQLRATSTGVLFEERAVGRARLPATVLGLLFHGAEHTTRHVGQLITTLKVVRGAN